MSGITNFLTPYTHWLFAHRNTVIVVLGLILLLTAGYSLIAHWRIERLERDLARSRSGAARPQAGRYAPMPAPVEERPADPGALPPVKGGRTYARNLGSALQKAGMGQAPSPPIYSPPAPTGWSPNTANTPPVQPQQPPLYSPSSSAWGTPAPQGPASWPYPPLAVGPGRPGGSQLPPQAPTYQPPPPTQQPQGAPPTFYPMPFPPPAQPQFAGQGPGPYAGPPLAPPGMPAPPAGYQPQPEAAPAGPRGKGKRRRFNLSVLESLEKFVQPRLAAAPHVEAPPMPPAPTPTVAPAPPAPIPSAPAPAAATAPQAPAPVPPSWTLVDKAAPAAPAVEPSVAAATPPPVTPSPPAPMASPFEFPRTPAASTPEPGEAAAEPAPESEKEPQRDRRRAMRSMLFGEEPAPATAAREAGRAPAESPEQPAEPSIDAQAWPAEAAATEVEPVLPMGEPEPAQTTSSVRDEPVEPAVSESPSLAAEPAPDAPAGEAHEPSPEAEAHPFAWEPSTQTTEPSEAAEAAHAPVDETPAVVEDTSAAVASTAAETAPAGSAVQETESLWPAEPEATPEPPAGSAGTLVIIEDDQSVAQYYQTLFQGNGYRVEVANDGVSGVDLCARVQPHVILLDVMMPRQNGILVLQTLRASDETRNTPVVVMSNFSEPTLIKRALQLGALEYVIKTQVEGPALLQAVPRWMNREKAFAAA